MTESQKKIQPNTPSEEEAAWEQYKKQEFAVLSPIIEDLGFALDEKQVQIGGERYLLSPHKLVLTGIRIKDNKRVILKWSSSETGMRELEHERICRSALGSINFAYNTFFSPEELLYVKTDTYAISVTSFIPQDITFIARPLEEQFFLALRAFEAQEGAHATTYGHMNMISNVFGARNANDYIQAFETFYTAALSNDPDNKELHEVFAKARAFLSENKVTIERYSGFLTHHDFVPHNLRVVGRDIYLLDNTSIDFANKYEGWARFINFMTQFNPELERALAEYVRNNRSKEEFLCLRLMRVYKLGYLLKFRTESLKKTSGDMHQLAQLRITFWLHALAAVLNDSYLPDEEVRTFVGRQESLRSQDEIERQKEISARQ